MVRGRVMWRRGSGGVTDHGAMWQRNRREVSAKWACAIHDAGVGTCSEDQDKGEGSRSRLWN